MQFANLQLDADMVWLRIANKWAHFLSKRGCFRACVVPQAKPNDRQFLLSMMKLRHFACIAFDSLQ
jgi:hypothetical protein